MPEGPKGFEGRGALILAFAFNNITIYKRLRLAKLPITKHDWGKRDTPTLLMHQIISLSLGSCFLFRNEVFRKDFRDGIRSLTQKINGPNSLVQVRNAIQ